jgi:hypothetical protein
VTCSDGGVTPGQTGRMTVGGKITLTLTLIIDCPAPWPQQYIYIYIVTLVPMMTLAVILCALHEV